jgi:hypothetical protein
MATKPFYTSNTLIEAVKRSMSMPISQITFSDEDILAFASEEMYLSQLPSILQYHEEYYVFEQIVPLKPNVSKYPIPNRAIGMKLRDLFYQDTNGDLREMTKINPDDEAFFQTSTGLQDAPYRYKIENNSIVILPQVAQNPTGNLVFRYFLRPNALVKNDRAVICSSFAKTITVTNSNLQPGDEILIAGNILVAGTDFVIGTSSSATAGNLNTVISSLGLELSTISTANVIEVDYFDRNLSIASNSPGLTIQSTISVKSSQVVPDIFAAGKLVDILQEDGGHSTYKIDVRLPPGSVSQSAVSINEADLPTDFVLGDYICLQYESIIPQIPTDLHILLAERTAARILQALGDSQGLDQSNKKIQDYEARQSVLIDTRVDGSPMKVLNTHSILRYSKRRSRR